MTETIRILYVDDEQTLLDLCKMYLERSGDFIVTILPSAPEAIRILELARFDAIISDYQMPEMDGIEFLKVVRARGDKTPFIIFTGKGREEVVIDALNAGADFYLQKGGEPKAQFTELAHKIKKAVEGREAERALRETNEYLHKLIDFANAPIIVWDNDFRITYFNHAFEHLTGRVEQEVIGQPLDILFPKESRDNSLTLINKTLKGERWETVEIPILTKEGSVRTVLWNSANVLDPDGRIISTIAQGVDITDRKAAEHALKKSQIQLAEAMDLANLVNWEFDVPSGIFTFNDRFYSLYGTTAEHEGGYQMPAEVYAREFVHPDEVGVVSDEVQKAITATDPNYTTQIEHRIIRRDGEIRHIIVRFGITKDAEGRTVKTHGANEDITDRKIAEEDLKARERSYRTLAENLPGIVYRVYVREKNRMQFFNDMLLTMTGYTPEELSEGDICSIDPLIIADDRDQVIAEVDAAKRENRKFQVDYRIIHKDGSLRFFFERGKPIFENNELLYIDGIIQDITTRKTSEQALRESEERSRALVENASDIIRILDTAGRIVFDTAASSRQLGYPPGYSLGRHPFDFIHPDDLARVRQEISLVYSKTNTGIPTEFRIRRADGSYTWVESVGKNLIGVPGVDGIVITTRFIDERKKAEEAQRESEERFRHISELIADFAYSYRKTTGAEFTIDWITGAVETITGYTADEIKKMTGWKFLVIKEDIPVFEKNVTGLLPGEYIRSELRIRRKDGGMVWLASFAECISDPNKPGYPRLYGGCRDITTRKQTEETLVESEERFRTIVEQSTEIFFILNSDGKITYISPGITSIFGYDQKEVTGRNFIEFLPAEDIKRVMHVFLTGIEQGTVVKNFDMRILRKDGSVFFGELNGVPYRTDRFSGAAGVIRDITEHRQAEAALRDSEARYRFLAENTSDTIWMMSIDGTFIYHSPAVERLRGYTQEEANHISLDRSFTPASQTHIREIFLVEANKPVSERWADRIIELEMYRKDGSTIWTEVSVRAVRDAEGNVTHLQGSTRDITGRKQAEEELRITHEKYTKAFLSVPDAITISELDSGRFVEVNDAATRIFGYSRDELMGKSALELGIWRNKEDRDHFIDQVRKHVKVSKFEVLNRRKSGELYNALVNADTISIGNVPYLIAIIRDITDRKKVEEALVKSEEKFQSLYMHMIEGSALHELTYNPEGVPEDYVIIEVNPAFEMQLGISRDTVIGKTSREAYGVAEPPYFEIYARVALTGESTVLEAYYPPLAKHFSISAFSPHKGSFATILEDITERKRMEEALQKSEAKSRSLLENVPELILVHRNGIILYTNPAAVKSLGYQPHEVINSQVTDFIAPEFHERVAAAVCQRMSGKPVEPYEIDVMSRDGSRRTMVVNGNTIEFDGAPASLIILVDITERKKVEGELKKSEVRYRSVVEDQTEFICRFTPDGKLTFVNEAYCRYFSLDRIRCLGNPHTVKLTPEDAQLITDHLASLTPKNPVNTLDHRIIMPSGEVRWQRWNDRAIFDENGTVIEYQSVGRDITEEKKIETELQSTKRRLADIINGLPDPTFVIDNTSSVTAWNHAMEALTGVSAAEMIGRGDYAYALPFYGERRKILIDLVLQYDENEIAKYSNITFEGKTLVADTTIATPKAKNVILWGKATALYDYDGNAIGAVEVIRDITEKKRAEQEIRTLQQFQQNIIDNANVWISVLDPKGTILVWNTTAEQISGYPAQDVIGKNTVWKQLYPDPVYRKQVAENILDVIKKNTYVENFETRIRTKGGDEKIIWWNTQPMRDASGKPVQFIAIGRDNTERRQAEERIHALRQFEESVIKNANIWISVLDGKGNVSVWNRAAEEISGYKADEVIGKNTIWSQMYPDKEYRRTVTAKIKEVIGANKYLENFETRIRTKYGQERIIWWNTRVLQDVPGLDETFIAIGKDVTEQTTLHGALRQANKQLNLLSSITRHDILNQLMALRGYIELSRDYLDDKKTLVDFLEKEETIARIIEEQIIFTRDYQELGIAAPEWQNVNASIKKAVAGLPMRAVHVEVDPKNPVIFADRLFEKVFYNLIDNALKYGGEGMKTIRVSSQESDSGLRIVCEDDGVGISGEDKKKLFTRGFGKNTGLGLFLSREILAITGITITENSVPGNGARFEITVPKGMYRFGNTSQR